MPFYEEKYGSPNVITYTGGVNSKAFARVNFNDDLSTVSYTHLDVYKRQGHGTGHAYRGHGHRFSHESACRCGANSSRGRRSVRYACLLYTSRCV